MKSHINTAELLSKINQFSEERNWAQFHSIKNLAMALSVEVAELLEIYQWKTELESNDLEDTELQIKAKEEIADIFIYLLRISSKLNIDLEKAVNEKMALNEIKYPIEKSLGNSKKYTEF